MSVNLNFPNIVGTNTSDATATESDIAVGKTAYVNGTKVTGTKDWVDTSDATATESDIAIGKTAYVNGVKVTGIKEDTAQDVVWVDNASGTLKSIKDSSGNYYTNLSVFIKEINIPNGITSIVDNAFRGCSSLTSINIPDSVTSIGEYVFYGCKSLTSITIPNSVTSMGNYTFNGCSSLTSITIPNSVTSIGFYVFDGCSSLTSITIPNSVTSIGNGAFYYCINLANIYYKGTEEQWNAMSKGTDWNYDMGSNVSGGTVIHYNS